MKEFVIKLLAFSLPPLLAYLVGSIPFAYIIAASRGVDIRKVGSGNVGATNVFRTVSKPLGILTFILDALKGWLPVTLAPVIFRLITCTDGPELYLKVMCGVTAVLGHTYPVYLSFRGGKGVATGAGTLLGIAPYTLIIGLCVWIITFLCSRYVALASIMSALSVVVSSWILYRQNIFLPVVLSLLAVVIIWRHRSNIKRLMNGTEYRFGKK
jgi:glycerol-3-phosphate acyltransferase PlsY